MLFVLVKERDNIINFSDRCTYLYFIVGITDGNYHKDVDWHGSQDDKEDAEKATYAVHYVFCLPGDLPI